MSDPVHLPAERRRFLLIDAITLVAAAALVFSANLILISVLTLLDHRHAAWDFLGWGRRIGSCTLGLIVLSLAMLFAQSARPSDRRRLRNGAPGLMVHLVITILFGLRIAGWAEIMATQGVVGDGRPGWSTGALEDLYEGFRFAAILGIAASWITLAIVGRWRPERAWDDRLGRFIGVVWFLFVLGTPFLNLMP